MYALRLSTHSVAPSRLSAFPPSHHVQHEVLPAVKSPGRPESHAGQPALLGHRQDSLRPELLVGRLIGC
eukprot:15182951-Alexandrium_andersonii.AAC.1